MVRLTPRGLSHLWLRQYCSPLFQLRVGERMRSWTASLIFSLQYLEVGQGETVAGQASVISYRRRRVVCGMLVHSLMEGLLDLTYICGVA